MNSIVLVGRQYRLPQEDNNWQDLMLLRTKVLLGFSAALLVLYMQMRSALRAGLLSNDDHQPVQASFRNTHYQNEQQQNDPHKHALAPSQNARYADHEPLPVPTTSAQVRWREDSRCDDEAAMPDGTIAQCNPSSRFPCCGKSGWCGITSTHCLCDGCLDFRKPGVANAIAGRRAKKPSKPKHIPGEDGTYAQNYQDTWLVEVARRNKWPLTPEQGRGFFLDLGAYHGTWCSNSALLEKKFGWQGICVEPIPVGFEDRGCVLAARPLSDTSDKQVRFFGHGQEKHIGTGTHEGDDPGVEIQTITIGDLLDCANGTTAHEDGAAINCASVQGRTRVPTFIHFASLDIEGLESNLLRTFPWAKVRVGVWIVEQTQDRSRPAGAREATREILKQQGYLQVPVENPGVDEYFVLPEFWEESLKRKAMRIHPDGSHGC